MNTTPNEQGAALLLTTIITTIITASIAYNIANISELTHLIAELEGKA